MSSLCEKLINGCIAADCSNPIYTGIESVAYIFNRSQIESFTFDQTNPNIVTAINMAEVSEGVDYVGYKIEQLSKTPFTGTTTTMNEGTVQNTFTEAVSFVVPDNSPAASMILDSIANGSFVVVLVNEYEGSDSKGKYQIFGSKKSLKCTACERDAYGDDTQGGWAVTLTAEGTPKSAVFVHHETTPGTDDTKTYLESLVDCGD